MTDHSERACRYCGSLLHHEDVCEVGLEPLQRDTCDRCCCNVRIGDRDVPEDDEPLYCDPCAQTIAGERGADLRAAYIEMAEECERRAAEHEAELAGCGKRGRRCGECAIRDARAIDARDLAAWARGRAG